MGLQPLEIGSVVAELNERLLGATVQKVFVPNYASVVLELRKARSAAWLCVDVTAKVERLSARTTKPAMEGAVPAQTLWRSVLKEAVLTQALADEQTHSATLVFETPKGLWSLWLALAPPAFTALVNAKDRVVAVLAHAESKAPLRAGDAWQPLAPRPRASHASRLLPVEEDAFPQLQAAERLFNASTQVQSMQSARAPLLKKLKKLEGTYAKVSAEAERESIALQHLRDGELIKKSAHAIARGATSVTLTEYLPDGQVVERTLSLDPKRAPKELAEWHFHQYRRLSRGVAMARKRLFELDAERETLRGQLERVEAGAERAPSAVALPRAKERQARASAYREYASSTGQAIWVGRGAKSNDELTFHVAKPYHVWLHLRGMQGAHVVVPVSRGAEFSQHVLIDAAHLALHHSGAKGEDRAEVSYTLAKYVRKPKGAAAGAVTITHEKTFWLVVDAARLERLLKSARG
jgi:predicted ribosome quality control (RQC) complex YloA/Tae2 family protein